MNLPNKLTLVRIILIPVIMIIYAIPQLRELYVFTNFPYLSLANFLIILVSMIAMLTDLLDGKIARKYNLVTDLGKFLDPLADKLLVLTLLLILMDESAYYEYDFIKWWMVIIIIAREFMVTGMRLVAAGKKVVIAASMFGKVKTTIQFSTLLVLLFGCSRLKVAVEGSTQLVRAETSIFFTIVSNALIVLMLAVTVFSGVDYMIKNKEVFKDETKKKSLKNKE